MFKSVQITTYLVVMPALLVLGLFVLCSPAAANETLENDIQILSNSLASHFKTPFPLVQKGQSNLSKRYDNLKGWEHLFDLLVTRGIAPEYAAKIIRDKRMPAYKPLYYSVDPKESSAPYRRRNNRAERKNALEFYKKHKSTFEEAEKKFGVDQSVLLALLQIETRCGNYTGRSRVFHRLARLAGAAKPENVEKSFQRKRRKDKSLRFSQFSERALWLEETFLPHAVASIVVAKERDTHPHELRGSSAGAIGLPQFLPGNQLIYGVDADKNGQVDLFKPKDAIHSVANYLRSKGWKKGISQKEKEGVIWHYNRSKPYVETVLTMASRCLLYTSPSPRDATLSRMPSSA